VNSFKTPIMKVTGLLALALLLAFGCAETPKDPDANRVPDTFITSYGINMAPDSSTYYNVTVYWRGSDFDGEPATYRYWVGTGDSTEISETRATVALSFPDISTTYDFYVQTKDNVNGWDPTPANVTIDMTDVRDVTDPTFLPNTLGLTIPPDGASTSQAIPFAISGTDVDGIVPAFEWAVDDPTSWTEVAPDVITVTSSIVEILLGPSDLSLGAHTIYFRALDNMGNVDPSPLTVSLICEAGYAPELSVSISDGQSFIVPFTDPSLPDFTISFVGTVDFYYGKVDSFVVSTSEGQNLNTTENEINLGDLGSGAYWVDVTVYDAAGSSTSSGHINFTIVELPAGDGLLCINGVDWPTYGGEASNLWSTGVPWGNRTHYKTWDLFDTSPIYSGTDFGDSLLGKGSAPPTWMIDTTFFDAVVWVWNYFSGDNAYWLNSDMQTAIMAYLESGGNVWIGGRYGGWIFDDPTATELYDYCQISGYTEGMNPTSGVAVHDSVSDMSRNGSHSLTHVVTTSHANAVQLYETDTADPGLGWVVLPNGAGGGGAVCYIGGRVYRWTNADLKANMDVILRYFFGIN